MNTKVKVSFLIALVTFVVVYIFFLRSKSPDEDLMSSRVRKEIYNFDTSKCPSDTINFAMNDQYLRGILEVDSQVRVALNWFACHPIKAGQLVLHKYSEFDDPVIRRVVGAPGDRFELKYTKSLGWNLFINKKEITAHNGKKYFFGGEDPPPLALANQSRRVLGPDELIVLSSFPPGDKDSSIFGVINKIDIVGLVQQEQETE